jgi:hypothetical protein
MHARMDPCKFGSECFRSSCPYQHPSACTRCGFGHRTDTHKAGLVLLSPPQLVLAISQTFQVERARYYEANGEQWKRADAIVGVELRSASSVSNFLQSALQSCPPHVLEASLATHPSSGLCLGADFQRAYLRSHGQALQGCSGRGLYLLSSILGASQARRGLPSTEVQCCACVGRLAPGDGGEESASWLASFSATRLPDGPLGDAQLPPPARAAILASLERELFASCGISLDLGALAQLPLPPGLQPFFHCSRGPNGEEPITFFTAVLPQTYSLVSDVVREGRLERMAARVRLDPTVLAKAEGLPCMVLYNTATDPPPPPAPAAGGASATASTGNSPGAPGSGGNTVPPPSGPFPSPAGSSQGGSGSGSGSSGDGSGGGSGGGDGGSSTGPGGNSSPPSPELSLPGGGGGRPGGGLVSVPGASPGQDFPMAPPPFGYPMMGMGMDSQYMHMQQQQQAQQFIFQQLQFQQYVQAQAAQQQQLQQQQQQQQQAAARGIFGGYGSGGGGGGRGGGASMGPSSNAKPRVFPPAGGHKTSQEMAPFSSASPSPAGFADHLVPNPTLVR